MNEPHTLVIDLHSGTTYYFWVISINGYGSAQSSLGTFMTLPKQQGDLNCYIVDCKHHYTCSGKYSSLI